MDYFQLIVYRDLNFTMRILIKLLLGVMHCTLYDGLIMSVNCLKRVEPLRAPRP